MLRAGENVNGYLKVFPDNVVVDVDGGAAPAAVRRETASISPARKSRLRSRPRSRSKAHLKVRLRAFHARSASESLPPHAPPVHLRHENEGQ